MLQYTNISYQYNLPFQNGGDKTTFVERQIDILRIISTRVTDVNKTNTVFNKV